MGTQRFICRIVALEQRQPCHRLQRIFGVNVIVIRCCDPQLLYSMERNIRIFGEDRQFNEALTVILQAL